jgi:hypothetical protein
MRKKIPYIFAIFFLTIAMITGCSDDDSATGPDELDDPPSLPTQVNPVTIDLSYFAEQEVPDEEEYSNYHMLRLMVENYGSLLNTGGGTMTQVSAFLELAQLFDVEPEYSNGTWVWTFDIPADLIDDFSREGSAVKQFSSEPEFDLTGMKGFENRSLNAFSSASEENVRIQIHATPNANGIEWEVYFTGLLFEQEVNDFPFITGLVSADEATGEWNFFHPETGSSVPVLTYTWSIGSNTTYESNITILTPDGESYNMIYQRDDDENTLTVTTNGITDTLFWNTSTHSGYYSSGADGSQYCYQNFENTEC